MEGKTIAKGCLGLFTFSIAGFSLATIVVGIGDIVSGGPDLGATVGAMVFLFAIFSAFSFITYKLFTKKKVVADPYMMERKALMFAQQKQGYVAVADFALHENLSIDEAGKLLDLLALKNVARVEVSGSGKLVYLFDAFIGVEEPKKDTLELAIQNAINATQAMKEKKAAEEANAVHVHVEEHSNY